ncbi:hypothetical protein [Streptomyces doebereineriae]|uniref:ABC transporter permease n=1 Tax=Streptomyces doebereineriae TaxID=3075528 RepID=A0ABU2VGH9_9ACTN|nr:hypothetical protein [Streptomyces sp. DSM 41640]MDT0484691.1 hypothetical protein [Streptomyces sp. DSM 41640]
MLLVAGRVASGSTAFLIVAEALMIAVAVLLGFVIERITVLESAAFGATVPVAPFAEA